MTQKEVNDLFLLLAQIVEDLNEIKKELKK